MSCQVASVLVAAWLLVQEITWITWLLAGSVAGADGRLRVGDCILYVSFVVGVEKRYINLSSEFDEELAQTLNDITQTAVHFRWGYCLLHRMG